MWCQLFPQDCGQKESFSIPRLQRSNAIANRLNSLSAVSLGVRQGAKTMQNEAPTASNKMQVLDAASFACDGAFPSHAEKKTNPPKKVQKFAE